MSNDVLDAWYAAIRTGSPEAFEAVVTPDVVLYWNGDSARIAWAGSYRGAADVARFFASLREHLTVVAVTEVSRTITADVAVVVLDGVWRMQRSGKTVEARACNIFRFQNGRVAAYEVYNDTGRFDAAMNGRSN